MCKIVVITNSSKFDFTDTVETIGNLLLETEPDGFGYAAVGEKGIFGEKTLDDEFQTMIQTAKFFPSWMIRSKSESFGSYSKLSGPMILHGRISTNKSGLKNTHPMIRDNNYMIHNGVITDHGDSYKKATDNDSEDLQYRFLKGIKQVEKHITGYYAFANIDSKNQLHVCRDRIADLYVTYSESHETYIFATTRSLIDDIAEDFEMIIGPVNKVRDDLYMIFQGNDIIHHQSIKSRGYDDYSAGLARKSLGRNLVAVGDDFTEREDYERYNSFLDDSDDHWLNEEFYNAIQQVDDTCSIIDKDNNSLTATEFHTLPFKEQKLCLIEFSDGQWLQFIGIAS